MAKAVDDAEKQEEKQVPVKPKKKSGGGGDIGMLTLIGTIAGTVVLMVVIMSAAFYFFIMPQLTGGHGSDSTASGHEKIKERGGEEHKGADYIDPLEEEDIMKGEEGVHMIETGRIISNPKGSTKYAILNLALEFRTSSEDERFPEGAEITIENEHIGKVLAFLKNKLNGRIGSLTVDDFYAIGSDSLRSLLKEDFKPIFRKNKIFLRDVLITEYLIQ